MASNMVTSFLFVFIVCCVALIPALTLLRYLCLQMFGVSIYSKPQDCHQAAKANSMLIWALALNSRDLFIAAAPICDVQCFVQLQRAI